MTSLRNGLKKIELEELSYGLNVRFNTLWEGGMQPIIVTERDVRRRLSNIAIGENQQARVLCWDELKAAQVNVLGTL